MTAQGDADIFPGTVWSANYGSGNITVFEPDDYDAPPPGCTGADNAALDEDGDLFDNADEIDNGTNPCSAASHAARRRRRQRPAISTIRTTTTTAFSTRPTSSRSIPHNGTTTTLPVNFTWDNDDPPEGGLLGLGFTGLMTNGIATTRPSSTRTT